MGQKTHPIGLRVGLHRKWNTTWYQAAPTQGSLFNSKESLLTKFNQSNSSTGYVLSTSPYDNLTTHQGVINSRGGDFSGSVENTLSNLITRYAFSKYSEANRLILVDVKLFKATAGHLFVIVFYTKLLASTGGSSRRRV